MFVLPVSFKKYSLAHLAHSSGRFVLFVAARSVSICTRRRFRSPLHEIAWFWCRRTSKGGGVARFIYFLKGEWEQNVGSYWIAVAQVAKKLDRYPVIRYGLLCFLSGRFHSLLTSKLP